MLCTFVDLTNCFYFVTVISTFDTPSRNFLINLSAVPLFVLSESFDCFKFLELGVTHSLCMHHHLNCGKASQIEIFTK